MSSVGCAMPEIGLGKGESAWMQFFHMIREECPHCRVEDLIIVNGSVSNYRNIRYSKVPPRESIRTGSSLPDVLNSDWVWFIQECQELCNGIIPEVHFRNGNPFVLYGDIPGENYIVSDQGGDRAESSKTLVCV